MKKLISNSPMVLLVLMLTGCNLNVEVPKGEVAVVIKNNANRETTILQEGAYTVSSDSKIVFYNINSKQIDFAFDFIFNDAAPGDINFSLIYVPVVDSLAKFYEKYKSDNINPVVEAEIKSIIRKSLEDYNKGDLTNEMIYNKIIETMNENHEILKYVIIKDISSMKIDF